MGTVFNVTKGTDYGTVTLASAISNATTTAGDTLLCTGTFTENSVNVNKAIVLEGSNPTTSCKLVTTSATVSGFAPTVQGVTIKGFEIDASCTGWEYGGIYIRNSNAQNLTVDRCHFTKRGIYVLASTNGNGIIVKNCTASTWTGWPAVQLEGSNSGAQVFDNNFGTRSIQLGGHSFPCQNATVRNNVINGSDHYGIYLGRNSTGNVIRDNTIQNCADYAIRIGIDASQTPINNEIYNNKFINCCTNLGQHSASSSYISEPTIACPNNYHHNHYSNWNQTTPYPRSHSPFGYMFYPIEPTYTGATSSISGTTHNQIQTAITNCAANGILNVTGTHTYTGQINLTKSMKFIGSGTITRSDGASGDYTMNIGANNVTFAGPTHTSPNTRGIIVPSGGNLFWTAGTITVTPSPQLSFLPQAGGHVIIKGGTINGYVLNNGNLYVLGGTFPNNGSPIVPAGGITNSRTYICGGTFSSGTSRNIVHHQGTGGYVSITDFNIPSGTAVITDGSTDGQTYISGMARTKTYTLSGATTRMYEATFDNTPIVPRPINGGIA